LTHLFHLVNLTIMIDSPGASLSHCESVEAVSLYGGCLVFADESFNFTIDAVLIDPSLMMMAVVLCLHQYNRLV